MRFNFKSSSVLILGLLSKVVRAEGRKCYRGISTMDSEEEIRSSFQELIEKHKIVVFSKTTCPFCNKVKQLFQELREDFFSFELNTYSDAKCSQMQDVLQSMTSQRTVPNVFIRQHHVGGCTDTQQALADGTILDMLEGTFQTYDFDYIVIGGGSGGLASSKEAASYGRRVAVCDLVTPSPSGTTWGLGGTCVNVGCIPKKLMHKSALIGEDIHDSPHFGWTTDNREHNWKDMVVNVQNYIHSLNWKYKKSLKDKKVTYFNAHAKFVDKHTLSLFNKNGEPSKIVTAQNFLIATGGRPVYPDFPGAREHCISSDDIFSLMEHPGTVLIVGGSYIALETAGFLVSLGITVHVMVRSILLRGFDQEIARMIGGDLKDRGVNFIYNVVPVAVERLGPKSLKVTMKGPEDELTELECSTVFLAVGREPCTSNIGLQELNVERHDDGRLKVNEYSQSSVRNIFAVGDIIEKKLQLTPVAIQAGQLLARRLYGKGKILFDYAMVPTTVFTPLEYGSVGLPEEVAIETYGKENIEVYHTHFQPLEWELPNRSRNKCFCKLICVKNDNERVVGFHYLGPNAGEVTQGFALALKLGATKSDFDNLIGIHPTCAEIFTKMDITKSSGKPATGGGC